LLQADYPNHVSLLRCSAQKLGHFELQGWRFAVFDFDDNTKPYLDFEDTTKPNPRPHIDRLSRSGTG
jgi:hypothetical protein